MNLTKNGFLSFIPRLSKFLDLRQKTFLSEFFSILFKIMQIFTGSKLVAAAVGKERRAPNVRACTNGMRRGVGDDETTKMRRKNGSPCFVSSSE
jgi:hypothetical protein